MFVPQLDRLLDKAQQADASDLHLISNAAPVVRIHGQITVLEPQPISAEQMLVMLKEIIPAHSLEQYMGYHDLDFTYNTEKARYRVNCFWERGNGGMVARVIPFTIPTLEELSMPEVIQTMCQGTGLVLFTGATGSGKSTNLASLIEHININTASNIITLEDPIEFLFESKKSVIRQREVGRDMQNFSDALRSIVRQDPDVVMIGEMRDLETIASAMSIAETGHLVLATLHTISAPQTIDRIIGVFPPYQQEQIRMQLSMNLIGIIAQQLVPKAGGGRLAAREVLYSNPAVRNMIRDNKVAQLRMVMETSAQEGMFTMEQHLEQLLKQGLVVQETVSAHQPTV
ncbi:PilT/PilU family type 4a pilus ATPase [Candidatus Uhrbacteria bacterium]|nr:PilT/PilU family type 4a pilus ATPase [Candidatus Uhrbacteria bacterium]